MYRIRRTVILLLLCTLSVFLSAQNKPGTKSTETKDVDPLALEVLKAVTQPIEQAQTFSFKALVSEEQLATNGQIVTFFHTTEIRVQRPDKVHLIFQGRGERVDFYGTGGLITMYSPATKLYATMPAKATIDDNLADITAKGIDMPVGPYLSRHLYELASKNLITGYVIGRVKIFDQEVHQLAFTAPDVDWQLWVTGGESPRIMRAESVNKKLEGKPRTIVQFLDWDLSPTMPADEFTFAKPSDAHQIEMLMPKGDK
ncbi:MAG TPA: DUF2092 domain-containing protein [Candidatus Acidoferrum sp.]|nr:DUF2092 domain-containing protein [Candidatus Acidoferrum sp.]